MNVLFLSLSPIRDINQRGLYEDLLRQFVKNGHHVRIVSAIPGEATQDIQGEGYDILRVDTPQMQKVGFIKKGIASLRIGPILRRALAKYCSDECYGLILVATPPITIAGTVEWVKRRDGAKVYLLLKDIWPQGIADLGAISPRGLIYKYYRFKEKKLYALSDRIGCMSQANVEYLLRHNPEIDPARVEVCPNSAEPIHICITPEKKNALLEEQGIPLGRTIFIYGGNLGPAQSLPFFIECLKKNEEKTDRFFVICGSGTQDKLLKDYIQEKKPSNVLYTGQLARETFDQLVAACDVGLIFLNYHFTIPNFPSRLLSYMQAGIPVLCCTDPNTDIGDIAEMGGFGWKCLSNDVDEFCRTIDIACQANLAKMGAAARDYMAVHYSVEQSYRIITGEQKEKSNVPK